MTTRVPLELHQETVQPDWIDYNGHMNVAYYVLAFDHATDAFLDHVGLGRAYAEGEGGSVFVLEAHVTYERELTEGDPLRIATRLLDADAKRLHLFHAMYHAKDGFLAATNELLLIHVDLQDRRSAPLPEKIRGHLAALVEADRTLPRPPKVGRVIGLRRPGAA